MKKYFAALFFLVFTTAGMSQVKQTIVKSSVAFQVKHLGISVTGNFNGIRADIRFDPAHLEASTIEASIQTGSVNTGNESRDRDLKGDGYFDAGKYPSISMKSVSFKHNGGDNYTGTFSLSIKDKTSNVDVPFTYSDNGNSASFKGTFKIKRSDYDVGGRSLIMSNEVNISIEVTTSK